MASYSYWHGIASGSGSIGLANITDATYAGDPAGTDSDSTYWESRAYDQISAILIALGSSPGSGVDGSFTVNQDAAGAEAAYLRFGSNGAYGGADPGLGWSSSLTAFTLTHDLVSAVNLGSASTRISTLYASAGDFSGNVEIDGTLTLNSTLSLSTLQITGDLGIEGTTFTLNEEYAGGSPTEHAYLSVERGTKTNSSLKFLENGDATSRWQAYNLWGGAYNDILITDTNGVASWDGSAHPIFDATKTGSSNKVARADHTHGGGTLAASGTTETTFTLDDDWASGTVDIKLMFANSTHFISLDPSVGTPEFVFSHGINIGPIDVDDLTVNNDIALTGAISGDLRIDGTDFILDDNGAGGVDITLSAHVGAGNYRRLRWSNSGSRWEYTNDGSTYYYMVGANSSDDISLPGDLTIAGNIIGAFNSTGATLTMNKGVGGGVDTKFNVERAGGDRYILWDESEGGWRFYDDDAVLYDIVGATKQQTLTDKTLTTPSMSTPTITSGGSWGGNPSFSGSPAFAAGYGAPFTVSSTTTVANLSASTLDGKAKSSFLYDNGTGKYVALKNIDMNGFDIDNYTFVSTPAAHASDHISGGSDEIAGMLGEVQGTKYTSWRVNSDAATVGDENSTVMYMGASNSYYMSIVDITAGLLGIGGGGIDIVPGASGGNQDLGHSSRYWRSAHIDQQIKMNLQGSTPSTDNGSVWFESGTPSQFRVRLGGTDRTIINSDNKTNIAGVTGDSWRIDDGYALYHDGGTNWYTWKSGSFLYTTTNGSNAMAINSAQSAFFYGDVYVDGGNKFYLDWSSQSYFKYVSGAPNTVQLWVDGALKASW
jgi:hypothetical protein